MIFMLHGSVNDESKVIGHYASSEGAVQALTDIQKAMSYLPTTGNITRIGDEMTTSFFREDGSSGTAKFWLSTAELKA